MLFDWMAAGAVNKTHSGTCLHVAAGMGNFLWVQTCCKVVMQEWRWPTGRIAPASAAACLSTTPAIILCNKSRRMLLHLQFFHR